ncbi:putative protein tyrosine phosphatase [Tieghemostelium lacteum]|uniref:protein-tyrosine-phosphatase n=1 Tax=Tieghemostelium lacteum TaxID=361077 RepID=A0A151Z9N1_TIELA|nr:putative protein tyrosine phosphatase [Tieghemostelium lacteum]|eukprot:KYQ90584.1 putative protein tyrosine phosphatase [Tieghemostelium lacteum]
MDRERSHIESYIESSTHRFILFDEPNQDNYMNFVEIMKKNNCVNLVRACEINYDANLFTQQGITVHEMAFRDGGIPSPEIIDKWLKVLKQSYTQNNEKPDIKTTIAIHCVAGLGRTPVLVTIALIEDGGKPLQSIGLIRDIRKGAINKPQLEFLKKYKPTAKKSCIIM